MIKNITGNKILANQSRLCKSPLSKAKGLMFTKRLKNKGYIFEFKEPKRLSLHMFFVFYPIDIIFLDSDKRVIEIIPNLKPFLFCTSKNKAKYAIELPLNSSKNIKINDRIKF